MFAGKIKVNRALEKVPYRRNFPFKVYKIKRVNFFFFFFFRT